MADSGKLVKMEIDYSDMVEKSLPEFQEMARGGKVKEALEGLLGLEKQTRMASDALSTGRVLKAIVQLCFDVGDWDLLNENIVVLTKRRSQLKTIYVEVPRARLTMELARIKEARNEITEAANVLQELQVETFGSMEKEEKVQFILEQMRLCLATDDFIRTQIISKKISTKFFAGETDRVQELKLKYYNLMIELCQHDHKYIAICQHYRAVFETPQIQESEERWKEALKNVVLFVLLAPYDHEQSDLMHRVYEEKKLERIPKYKEVVELFRRDELLDWSDFEATFGPVLRDGADDGPATTVFQRGSTLGEKQWDDFRKRVIEHNIRVVAKYYTRVRMQRLSELLCLTISECEEYLSQLVTKKTIFARIDRPAGVVSFRQSKDPSEVLNEWSRNLSSLMSLVSKTTHLINKEEMVHALVK